MKLRGRQPDKPGTFRIRPDKNGGMRLSGVRMDGHRVKIGKLTQREADEMATKLFPAPQVKPSLFAEPEQPTWDKVDGWGMPVVDDDAAASVAKTLNLPPPGQPPPPVEQAAPKPDPEEEARKARRAKNAKSLMDLGGIAVGWTAVTVGRKACDRLEKDAVKPDIKQVNELRESTKEMLIEMFGDSEITPWKMTILLFIGIPLSMIIQSPRRPKLKDEPTTTTGESSTQSHPLKSVP